MHIYTVSELCSYVKSLLQSDNKLADIWVRGEISNLHKSHAQHIYFTIKDSDGQLRCAYFKSDQIDQVKQVQQIDNGMAAIVHGHLSIYELRGDLQLYVDIVQPEGVGVLFLEFQQLKAKLEKEGLFEQARKRPLPLFPKNIGIVTSPTSAAYKDILNILSRRYPLVEVTISPTLVQGLEAIAGIVKALHDLSRIDTIDLIILARGGGSLEDLWAFNTEDVARAIYASRVPVITGVGHETDFTIADFVADFRAPTPSAAAEIAVPDRGELQQQIEKYELSSLSSINAYITRNKVKVQFNVDKLKAPDTDRFRQRIDETCYSLLSDVGKSVDLQKYKLKSIISHLDSLNPQNTLLRGYALVQNVTKNEIVVSINQVDKGDILNINVSDGQFNGKVSGKKRSGQQGTLI